MSERRPIPRLPEDDRLPFRVLELGACDAIAEVLALASNPLIAQGAFNEAVALRPNRHIQLRHGARVMSRHEGR